MGFALLSKSEIYRNILKLTIISPCFSMQWFWKIPIFLTKLRSTSLQRTVIIQFQFQFSKSRPQINSRQLLTFILEFSNFESFLFQEKKIALNSNTFLMSISMLSYLYHHRHRQQPNITNITLKNPINITLHLNCICHTICLCVIIILCLYVCVCSN